MLHGYGSNKEDLFSFAEELPKEFCVISAQAPIEMDMGGYCWCEINFENEIKVINPQQIEMSVNLLLEFINEISEKYNLAPNEISFMGFSQGAILAYILALNYPKKVKNVLALSGYILEDFSPEFIKKEDYSHIDFFISHGKYDDVISINLPRESLEILKKFELNFSYKEYEMGHGIDKDCFDDMIQWINKKI
ncbi:phospholipase [Ichthyobacterium seriolicida]|uniref:Phospholipase n=2 Tax=Ichthyobacterium seriolicida TaxID=242600 RepID=A0A1J1EB39_9FLAO|nr:phospholipase [Ichthyobacterium seriolicida]